MEWTTWLAFFAASWAISISPGAGAVAAMTAGLQHGFARGYCLTFGLVLGLWSQLLLVGAGLGALIVASSTAFAVVKWLGVAYLLWLGISQWRAPAIGLQAGTDGAAKRRDRSIVVRGWVLNTLNPKGTLFMLAVVPQFLEPSAAAACRSTSSSPRRWPSPTSSSTPATPRSRRARWRRCARRGRCAGSTASSARLFVALATVLATLQARAAPKRRA